MKMGSNSKRRKRCTEDRLSELPDAILCHILSFLSTVEAVKTSVLSHRWENLWASVPTIDVCDYDPKEFDFDSFTMFLDRVLLSHDSSKVHRFRICCTKMVDPLLFDYWVSTAIGCNVVELDLDIYPLGPEHSSLAPQCFELPGSLFMLKSLEKLKLSLKSFVTITPEPSWFPSLKFLHVSVAYAGSHLMDNLFTCCPALEELTFEAEPEYDDDSVLNKNICAPKLKRLEISFFLDRHDLEILEYEHKLFINANAPNLEKFTFYGNLLAIYISNNAKSLNEAKIDCTDLHAVQELDDHLDAADNLHRLFTGILNVTYLSVSAPILGTLYHMEMGSSSKCSKRCAEDRLSELPDAILCHILSFLSTVEAVKTCVLSHRLENVWGAVSTIDLSDHDRDGKESDFDSFSVFIDRVLSAHESVKVHLFRLGCFSTVDPLRFDYWVRTAIGCNVVQLDLGIFPPQSFELPGSLFMLKSLEKLSLSLHSFITITPEPSWFPNLKFLNVSVTFASSHLMENFFSCCPVLEELIFDAWEYDGDSDFNINISAPKLKILQIRLFQKLYDHGDKLFINAYAPNLEKFTFKGHLLVIYTSSNAKSLNEAKIDCNTLHAGQELDYHLADHLHRQFKGLLNVTHLSVTAPIFGDPHIVHQYPLPTFVNLMNLELHLQACCSWQSFFSFLNALPNLISLVLEKSHDCLRLHYLDEVYHEWNPPECVPACLVSRLKLICIMDYRGTPDQMKMAEYLLKHGEVLSKVIVHWESFSSKKEKKLWRGLKKLPRGSKTCQMVFPCLSVAA